MLLENSGILNQISNKKNEQPSDHYKPGSSETLLGEVNENRVSIALKKTSEILHDIDCLLSNSKKWKMELLQHIIKSFKDVVSSDWYKITSKPRYCTYYPYTMIVKELTFNFEGIFI